MENLVLPRRKVNSSVKPHKYLNQWNQNFPADPDLLQNILMTMSKFSHSVPKI